jgi:hypothetical protein
MITDRAGCSRRSSSEVQELLRDYASSGLSRRKFSLNRGIAVSTLGHYLTRSRKDAERAQPQFLAVELRRTEPHSNLEIATHVDTSSSAEHAAASGLVVVLTGDRRIEVRRGFDAGVLEQLVRVLERV